MSFVERKLRATITLAAIEGQAQTFSNSGGADTVVIENLRMSAEILHAGGPADGTLELTIYGLSQSTINRLSTLGMKINLVPKNGIVLEAGDDASGMGIVFTGFILTAFADFNASPNVSFHITAQTLGPQATIPAKASSFKGSADIATIMSGFATQLGLQFENNGVTGKLENAYFSGSAKTQAQECVDAAGISWNHGEGKVLAIWPKNGSRNGQIPLVSNDTGMIGYPTYTDYGINIESIYNTSIGFGQKIQVQSIITAASGTWAVYGLGHHLESQMPNGKWFSTVLCYNPKFPTPVQ
jgi:hypothetical protein